MAHDPLKDAMAHPVSRRQLLKGSATAAGAAAFMAATGGSVLAASRKPTLSGGRTFQQESFAGVKLNGFSGGYSKPAEEHALAIWKAATGGDAEFNNVPFDEKPLAIAGIIATQDPSWDLMYTYDKFMQQFGARVLLPLSDGYTGDLSDFSPAILPSFTSQTDQVLRGLPIHFGGYLWGYNKALWEEVGLDPENPPTTWD
jgi:ABC-type glycerol-3-phosphate transport system substrate-binding protein